MHEMVGRISGVNAMEKSQEELIEEGSIVFGSFEGLLEKLPFQASTLRLIKAKQIKMSDKLRGDIERLIDSRRSGAALEAIAPVAAPAVAFVEEIPVAAPIPVVIPAPVASSPLDDIRPAKPGEPIEVDHPEAVAALFDEATLARLDRLSTASRLSPAQLVRVGTLRYMDQIEKTGEIIIRFNPKD